MYQSSTNEGEPLEWTKLDIDRISIHHYKSGLISASFPVHHFSFFKTVWDILSGKLYEAKMGVSYFYPWVSFPMKCQAYMEENPDNNSFGLEVICFNSENDKEMIQTSNYRRVNNLVFFAYKAAFCRFSWPLFWVSSFCCFG